MDRLIAPARTLHLLRRQALLDLRVWTGVIGKVEKAVSGRNAGALSNVKKIACSYKGAGTFGMCLLSAQSKGLARLGYKLLDTAHHIGSIERALRAEV